MWVSLASVGPPLGVDLTNFVRTAKRLLKPVDSDGMTGHYLNGPTARCIATAVPVPGPHDPPVQTEEGHRLISPHLLSLLLLSWSQLPVDHPGQLQWRSSGAAPFTTMEEFDAQAAHIAAFMASKVSLMLRHAYKHWRESGWGGQRSQHLVADLRSWLTQLYVRNG